MANNGKYVRTVDTSTHDDDNNSTTDQVESEHSSTPSSPRSNSQSSDGSYRSDYESDIDDNHVEEVAEIPDRTHASAPAAPPSPPSVACSAPTASPTGNTTCDTVEVQNAARIERMEKMIAGINEALSRFQPGPTRPSFGENPDATWSFPSETSLCTTPTSSSSIRWDHVKPFPSGIPANKMWEEWNRYMENFEIAATLGNVNDPVKRTQLLFLSMGSELQEIAKAAKLRPSLTNPDCYKDFVANVKGYFRSLTDTAAEHEAFTRMKQEAGEKAVTFHARLMCKVRSCNYSVDDEDRFVRAQLLNGLKNRELVKQARTYGFDTNFIVQSATRDETFEAETHRHEESSAFEVRKMNRAATYSGNYRKRPNVGRRTEEPPVKQHQGNALNQRSQDRHSRCNRCFLFRHRNGQCPALNRNCNRCGKRGHFVAACRQKQVNFAQNERNDISTDRMTSPIEDKYKDDKQQEVNALTLQDVLIDCTVGSSSAIRFLIDSGADANIIGGKDWERLEQEARSGKAILEMMGSTSSNRLHAYGMREPMVVECIFKADILKVGLNSSELTTSAVFYVVPKGTRSLLGRSTASDMGLLQINNTINQCETNIFPKMPGVKVRFSVNSDVPPAKNAYYNVPAAYREAARTRLHEMAAQGIIERVTWAPNWISGMSAVAKGCNDFRLVVNMRAANRAINREYYRLPLLDEMRVKLHGSRYFSKLDLRSAFYHLELSEESRDLTTFLAEDGMYRFTRLMFGVNCAPEIFQREMVRILEGIDNIIVFIDDILIFAETLESLRKTVSKVLQVLRENNLTLNQEKCEYDQTRIKFVGHLLDADGFHIDDEKIKSVRRFREPTTLSELRSFLGLTTFLSPYLENYANVTSPLWAATATKAWLWGPEQSEAFASIKQKIIECTISLGFFSDKDDTILYTDASPVALGAVLVQASPNQPPRIISFASKALTPTEKSYAQNQREALGAVWAVEHFSYFLLGRHFTLRTDAQGVSFILNRSREESKRALTRADGWALRLTPYSYTVEYVRGIDNIADSSSRLYDGDDAPFDDEASPWEIASLETNSIEFLTEMDIRTGTAADEILLQVTSAIETGMWHKDLRKYQAIENELTFRNGILLKTGCAVVPKALQTRALEVAHEGHPTVAKMKSIMRQRVWWPGMASDITKWVNSCETCCVNGKPERPTPMDRVFAPKTAWESIAIDFNGPYTKFGGILILVIVDYRSRYIIARPVRSTKFEHTKNVLDDVFDKEGYPKTIRTDNGPPFNGTDFSEYCKERDITATFSTPLFPQQNGLAESSMKVINKAMAAATSNKTDYAEELKKAIDAHNAAAHSVTKVPPEEVMYGRKIKRGLPLIQHGKSSYDEDDLERRDREGKIAGKKREDSRRGARRCRVKPGDEVVIERQNRPKGYSRFSPTRYTVIEERNGILILNDGNGKVAKRHVTQTKKVGRWRDLQHQVSIPSDEKQSITEKASSESFHRPSREKRAPTYLHDYVQVVENCQM
ncbi:uncharacterized protein K02A2.6-like [Aedes albopictus]|uniref:RNA-directed DNA polymerase n=1 Tax=Aedes albopictus TaxID=7160 RepID=A0ABM1XIM0_AEDAL